MHPGTSVQSSGLAQDVNAPTPPPFLLPPPPLYALDMRHEHEQAHILTNVMCASKQPVEDLALLLSASAHSKLAVYCRSLHHSIAYYDTALLHAFIPKHILVRSPVSAMLHSVTLVQAFK